MPNGKFRASTLILAHTPVDTVHAKAGRAAFKASCILGV